MLIIKKHSRTGIVYWSTLLGWTRDKSKALHIADRFRHIWELNSDESWEQVEKSPMLESDEEEACFT